MINVAVTVINHLDRVIKASDRIATRTLFKAGAYGRQVMRTALNKQPPATGKVFVSTKTGRKRRWRTQAGSPAGTPPYRRKGTLRDLVAYEVDAKTKKVTVGPKIFKPQHQPSGGVPVPRLLDVGGSARFSSRGGLLRFEPRPFVVPAYAKTHKKLPDLIRDASK